MPPDAKMKNLFKLGYNSLKKRLGFNYKTQEQLTVERKAIEKKKKEECQKRKEHNAMLIKKYRDLVDQFFNKPSDFYSTLDKKPEDYYVDENKAGRLYGVLNELAIVPTNFKAKLENFGSKWKEELEIVDFKIPKKLDNYYYAKVPKLIEKSGEKMSHYLNSIKKK
uniref:Uncharacterized protein n=1 Tax=Acrobeloides nanus TaxID=290746 RepID=A0A914DY52_9BILA